MKKRVLSLLLVCSMILSMFAGLSVTAFAADAEDGQSAEVSAPAAEEPGTPEENGEPAEEDQTEEPAAPMDVSTYAVSDFIVDDGVITSYNGDGGDVVIPETINGETITEIGDYAFDYDEIYTLVTSVEIPATVETIGTMVFNGQVTLKSVTFLGRCEEVGYYVFNDCSSLEIYCQPEDVAHYTSLFSEEETELTIKSLCSHEWETEGTVTKAPTCVEKGTMTVACRLCGETTTVDVDPLGHDYDETNKCTRCGERKPCDETSHVWNDGKVTLDPTCTAKAQTVGGVAGGCSSMSSGTTTFTACYNTGSVTSGYYAGGILGSNDSGKKIAFSDCYDAGTLTGTGKSYVGSMAGFCNNLGTDPKMTNCYYVTGKNYYIYNGEQKPATDQAAGNAASKATAMTAEEMKAAAASLGASYKADSGSNSGYPVLSWEKTCEHPAAYINKVTADHTISATFTAAHVVDLFQKFFENRTGLTAQNSTDKPWSTNDTGSRLVASGADTAIFTLTAASDGYLTVAVECKGTLTSLTLTSGGKTLEQITPVTAPYTTTKVVSVKANEPITFTYACTAVYGADDCSIAITNLALAADCPHTSKTMLEYTPATCETNGCQQHYICNTCGKVFDKDGNETTKDAVLIPAAHSYDEENVLFNDGTARILTCTTCKKTTVVANSGEGATTHTVTVTGENASWTAEGKVNAASYTVGDGKSFYFLASADVGYTLSVTGAEAVASYQGEAAGYSALYKLANVTSDASITLNTTEAPKSDYNFEVRTVGGEQVAYILGYTGNGGALTLPTEYNDGTAAYPVVGVAEGAFCGNGNYLDKQGSSPLESLETITSITVPKGIKYIEALAFDYVGRYQTRTWKLESVIFEDPDTVFVPDILTGGTERNVQLGGNPNLKTVQLPANLTKIPSSLFMGDTSLNNLVLPVGVTAIGARAFDGCTGLTNLTILSATPPTVETYSYLLSEQYPFRGCTVTITVPKGSLAAYQTAWKDMLEADTDLAGTIILREQDGEPSLTQFTTDDIDYLVVDREKMTVEVKHVNKNSGSKDAPSGKLVIPSTVAAVQTIDGQPQSFVFTVVGIGKEAMTFMGCEPSDYVSTSYWFAEVEFPNTLTYIDDWGCAGLEGVKVLDLSNTKVASIGDFAFNNCGNVETIKLPDTLQNLGKSVEIERPTDGTMDGNETDLGTADPGDESNVKADGPEAAPTKGTENVFRGCQKLKEFVVSDTNPYFSVKDGVLFNKNGTKLIRYPVGKSDASYAIPEGTQIIAEAASMQIAGNQANGALKSVTFPSSLKKIEDGAFRQSSLTSVELPAGVEFGSYIFDCSKNLQTVTTADGVTGIPAKAFWGCEALTNVTLAASVKSIGESAFERAGFKSIDLTNVTKIGKYAFYFSKLETVTVPAAAQCDTGAFMNCPELKTATLEGTTIYPYMFWYCTALETLNASNVTTIEDCTLGYCVKLTSLPLDHVTTIGNGAFRNCHGLTVVTVPATVQSFGKYVFADCGELTSVTFAGNENVTSLPEGTFYECVNLQEVHLGDYISQTEGLSLYMAGWYNGLKVNVYCNQPEEYFFRNQFDTCFIDLGNQQLDSENKDDITYIWTNTTYHDDGEPVYHFRAAAGGGCGGCGGGTSADADGRAEYTMSPSVNAIFHYAAQDGGVSLEQLEPTRATALYSVLPTVLTVYMQDRQTGEKTTLAAYTLSDLEAMATKSTAGYQYVGMKGWAVMVATEYVTIDRLLAGEALGTGDTLVVTADDASYRVTFDDLEANTYFFPNSKSNTNKSQEGKQVVPAMVALTWNTGKIETEPDSAALAQVAATAYKSTNLRFAHGLSWSSYEQLEDCDSMASDDVCSAMRMLQRVQSITLVRDYVKPTEAAVTVEATISGKNASVDASKLYDALDILADNGTLIVDAKKSAASGVSLTLPGADVRTLANKNAQLVIETALGSITLDAASLAGLASAAGSGNVVLTLDKLQRSSLSTALQNELDEHAAIYQLTATCGGKAVTTLNGTAQPKLPYTLQTDELAANVRTSILSGDTCTALTASYADGYASFTTTVLSRFAVDVPGKRSSVTISLTPTVSGGKASASVDADEAKKALEDLKDGGELILDATTSKAISASEVTLPKSILESLIKQKQSLRVRMNGVELALDASALSGAAAKLTGTSFRVCSEQLANVNLPKAARSTFENADLWRVWLTGGTRELTELTSGTASVTLTYTPEKTQNAADFRAYAVSNDGTYDVLTATNDKTAYTLIFSGRRLGVFALTDRLNNVMPFTDVYTSDWYYDDVRYVYENGLMNGVTTTLFAPKTNITRGMLVTILWRVEGEPTAPANSFTDVASGSYYEKAIAWAEYKGVVTGFGGGLFKPNAPITREQFVTILYRYASLKGMQTAASGSLASFSDAASVSAYAVDAVRWAVGAGLMNGKNGRIDPAGFTTRAESAALLHRYLA